MAWRRRRLLGWIGLALTAAIGGLAADAWAPPQHLPWRPLRLADPPGLATGLKFEFAARDAARCRAVLRQAEAGFSEAAPIAAGACAVERPLRLHHGVTALSPAAPVMTCQEALAYAFWTRHSVAPAARAELGSDVVRIDHMGTYACRNIRGRNTLSEHAYANAIDVAGFRLADGRQLTVRGDFHRDDARGRFLRRVRSGACDWFIAVLSPDYNAAHADHLHLDRGFWGSCS